MRFLPIAALWAAGISPALAQPDWAAIDLATTPVTENIYMLSSAAGGNIGVQIGEDGVLLIDDQFAQLSGKINSAVDALSDSKIQFVLNTHWHFDHVSDNKNMARQGAIIVAHHAVRTRMQTGQQVPAFNMTVPPAAQDALPIVTFGDSMTLHFNGQTIEIEHPASAHTDGDSVVTFVEANVVHTGDVFWNGLYPLIDASSGGSAQGMVNAVTSILARIDDNTRVIPGHGPLGSKADLQAYHDMIKIVVARIARLKSQGKSLEQAVTAKPTAEFDATWGKGVFTGDAWVGVIYNAL